MTGGSLGQRTASYGSLQLLNNNGIVGKPTSSIFTRKPSPKMLLAGSRDREKQFLLLVFCKFLGRRRVAMLLLVGLPLLIFTLGSYVLDKGLYFLFIFFVFSFTMNLSSSCSGLLFKQSYCLDRMMTLGTDSKH